MQLCTAIHEVDLLAEGNNPLVPSSPVSQGRIEGRFATNSDAAFALGHELRSRHSLDTPPKAAATRDERLMFVLAAE